MNVKKQTKIKNYFSKSVTEDEGQESIQNDTVRTEDDLSCDDDAGSNAPLFEGSSACRYQPPYPDIAKLNQEDLRREDVRKKILTENGQVIFFCSLHRLLSQYLVPIRSSVSRLYVFGRNFSNPPTLGPKRKKALQLAVW